MNVEVIEHNVQTGMAKVRFEYQGVVHEDSYNLKMVIPGSERIFNELGQEFTEEFQLKALDRLTGWIKNDIEAGTFHPRLDGNAPA